MSAEDYSQGLYRGVMRDKELALKFTAGWLEDSIVKETTMSIDAEFSLIKSVFDKYGFIVLTNVLSPKEINDLCDMFTKSMIECVDADEIKKNEKLLEVFNDYVAGKLPFPRASVPGAHMKGFVSLCNLPQSEFAWNARLNPRVKSIFSKLHDCAENDLCVSEDVPFYNPQKDTCTEADMWAHTDQNIKLKTGSDPSYQGIMYIQDATTDDTSNTVVMPFSHIEEYENMMNSIPDALHDKNHTIHVSGIPDDIVRNDLIKKWNEKSRRIPVPAGSLLIFNSKLIHQGYPSGTRLAQPICWEPKKFRLETCYANKLRICASGFGTTHWASLGICHGACFKKLENMSYSEIHHKCVFPHKSVVNFALKKPSPEKEIIDKMEIAELENIIKPEILSNL